MDIPIRLIDPDPDQPRKYFDEAALDELASSIKINGLAVPILVRPAGERYLIVHGERRYRACMKLGWETIPAEVREMTAEQAAWIALVENVQRADLTPTEEALAYQARLAGGMTQDALGEKIGKTRTYIAQKLRLLTLPAPVQAYLAQDVLSEGHARQLLRLRSIYSEELMADFSKWAAENANQTFTEPMLWQGPLGFAALRDIRPEDNPVCWFSMLASDDLANKEINQIERRKSTSLPLNAPSVEEFIRRAKLVGDACRLLDKYICDHAGKLPRWELAAFWWASAAAYAGLTVSQLNQALDAWQARFYSAFHYISLHGSPYDTAEHDREMFAEEDPQIGDDERRLRQEAHRDYYSDLRHAGALDWALTPIKELPEAGRDVYLRALEYVGQKDRFEYPSALQPWGFQYARFKSIMERMAA